MIGSLLLILLAGLLGPLLAAGRRPLVPAVVGELLAGIALGRSGFGFIDPSSPTSSLLFGVGFAMLMLVAGSHVDLGAPGLRTEARSGVVAVLVVIGLAVPVGVALQVWLAPEAPIFLLPTLLAGSSAAVAFPILEERRLLGPESGLLLAWIPLADALTALAMPLTLVGLAQVPGALAGDGLILVATAGALVLGSMLRRSARARELRDRSRARGWALQLRLTLLLLLVMFLIATSTGGSTLLAGFGAGLVLARLREPTRLAIQLSGVAEGFFVPAFFVLLGAELDLHALATDPRAIALAIAMALGAVLIHLIAARVVTRQLWAGFGLAASAQLGLPAAAASLGLMTGLLSPALGTALVFGGCLTVIPASFGTRRLADVLSPVASRVQTGGTRPEVAP